MKIKIQYLVCTLCFLFFITFCNAQDWEKTFTHDTGLAKGFDVISTADGNYVMVGDLDLPTGAIRHYIWLIKVDQEGNELWSKIYNYNNIINQKGRAISETLDGDLLIVGSNNTKASVLKTNSDGELLWTKNYGGDGENFFKDIVRLEDGNFILVGQYEAAFSSGLNKAWAVGMTSDGDTLWTNRFFDSTPFQSYANQISKLPLNHYLITGISDSQGFTLEFDPLAPNQTVWENIYQTSTEDKLFSGSILNSDNSKLVLVGASSGIAGYTPSILIADANDGTYQSQGPFNYNFFGSITDLIPTQDNGFLMTGSNHNFWDQNSQNLGFISKLNENLELEWDIIYQDSLYKQGAAVHQTSDGSFLIAGSRQNGMFLKKIEGPSTATTQVSNLNIKLYPNPALKTLTVELPENISNQTIFIDFYDSNSKLVLNQKISPPSKQINTSKLSSGIYFYSIYNSNGPLSSGKIIIK